MTDLLRKLPDLPPALDTLFVTYSDPEALFTALLPEVCQILQTDRCFLMLRQPATRRYRILCWRRKPDYPDISTDGWQDEGEWEQEDPLFAAALQGEESIFVPDVETADPSVLNREFERQNFKHRALIHAHLWQDGQLWGVLQPCIFGQPRDWSEADRLLIDQIVQRLTPIVAQEMQQSDV
ncbi:MAG TPA: GAF domain-containing protein [Allocoleopsis sp.]